jgi:hypothetical protein
MTLFFFFFFFFLIIRIQFSLFFSFLFSRTFGGLFAAGLRTGFGSTVRICMWASGTALTSAVTREVFKVGPRYEANIDVTTTSRTAMWINAVAGGIVAFSLLSTLTPPRRLLYTTVGSMSGVMLPQAMALAGPAVRKQLMHFLKADSINDK